MTRILNCLIVDDEPIAREGLAEYIEDTPFLALKASAKNALEAGEVLSEMSIDLLFLDIQMPKISGLDFLKTLSDPPLVVFTTAFREFGPEGFDLSALDYLVKPIAYPRFLKAAQKAKEQIEKEEKLLDDVRDEYFFIKSDGKYIRILLKDILYIEGLKDYVFIHTPEKRYMALISLKNVEKQLPANQFFRVHRSYIVAKDKVEQMEGNQLKIGEHKIPLSKNLRENIFAQIIGDKLWKRSGS